MLAPAASPATCRFCSRHRDVCIATDLPERDPYYDPTEGELVLGPHRIPVILGSHDDHEIELTTEQERLLVGWTVDCSQPSDDVVQRHLWPEVWGWMREAERMDREQRERERGW